MTHLSPRAAAALLLAPSSLATLPPSPPSPPPQLAALGASARGPLRPQCAAFVTPRCTTLGVPAWGPRPQRAAPLRLDTRPSRRHPAALRHDPWGAGSGRCGSWYSHARPRLATGPTRGEGGDAGGWWAAQAPARSSTAASGGEGWPAGGRQRCQWLVGGSGTRTTTITIN